MGSFVLGHTLFGSPQSPRRAILLHGVFGNRRNWRSFALRLSATLPDCAVLTVDLRGHGESRSAPGAATLEAAGGDILALLDHLQWSDATIVGHSFGGKVALEVARAAPQRCRGLIVLDCPLGPSGAADSDSEVARVTAALRRIPSPFARRSLALAGLEAEGLGPKLAGWLATTAEADPAGGFRWSVDLDVVDALLADYWRTDGYPLWESGPSSPPISIVVADRSDRWTASDLARLAAVDGRPGRNVHHLQEAGHWLHVDDPDGLIQVLSLRIS